MRPMLAETMELSALDYYINNDEWFAEQKLDGDRVLIHISDAGVQAYNREGVLRQKTVPFKVLRQFGLLQGTEMFFDGELLDDGTYWIFDLPTAGTFVQPSMSYEFRRDVLEQFFAGWDPDPCVRLLPCIRATGGKQQLRERIEAQGAEGLMLKHRSGLYRPGRRSRQMLKAKYVHSADVIVTRLNVDGHCNAHYSVFTESGELVEIGSCSMVGKPAVQIGDVIEVRYLYCQADGRLYQPRLLKVRHDKNPESCTLDQLRTTDRSVIDLELSQS